MSESAAGPWGSAPETPGPAVGVNATDFLAAQRVNRRNTWILILVLLLLGGALGYLCGALFEAYTLDQPAVAVSVAGVIGGGALISIGLIASAVTFAFGGKVILGLTGAREVEVEDEPMLHNVVEEMAIAAGLPKPRVAVIETDVPNAFATGMDPNDAAIGVTRGLLQTLNRDELQGVVGHEMGHIANWDTRYLTAVAILVGLISLICDGARRMMWYSGNGRSRGKSKDGGAAILLVIFIVFAVLAPIAAQLVRFAVSRQREYLADATSVRLTRNPLGLIGALEKLAAHQRPFSGANRATQHMFIVNPFKAFGPDSTALFSTHPPMEARVERLRHLGII